MAADSRDAIIQLLAREPGAATIAGAGGAIAMEMLWELVRCALQGLALWWYDHRDVLREEVVATAMKRALGWLRARRARRALGAGESVGPKGDWELTAGRRQGLDCSRVPGDPALRA